MCTQTTPEASAAPPGAVKEAPLQSGSEPISFLFECPRMQLRTGVAQAIVIELLWPTRFWTVLCWFGPLDQGTPTSSVSVSSSVKISAASLLLEKLGNSIVANMSSLCGYLIGSWQMKKFLK